MHGLAVQPAGIKLLPCQLPQCTTIQMRLHTAYDRLAGLGQKPTWFCIDNEACVPRKGRERHEVRWPKDSFRLTPACLRSGLLRKLEFVAALQGFAFSA